MPDVPPLSRPKRVSSRGKRKKQEDTPSPPPPPPAKRLKSMERRFAQIRQGLEELSHIEDARREQEATIEVLSDAVVQLSGGIEAFVRQAGDVDEDEDGDASSAIAFIQQWRRYFQRVLDASRLAGVDSSSSHS